MNDPTNKTELLNRIQTEHGPLEAILVQLTEEQMMQPGVEGKSSVMIPSCIILIMSIQFVRGWGNKNPDNHQEAPANLVSAVIK